MTELIKYNAACKAIAEAKAVDEVKEIRDQAEAMRVYARQAKNRSLEMDAAEIRIRAERRLGEMIAAQKATVGLAKGSPGNQYTGPVPKKNRSNSPPTLADAGIDKKLSSRAQKVAALSASVFEGRIKDWRKEIEESNERITTKLMDELPSARQRPMRDISVVASQEIAHWDNFLETKPIQKIRELAKFKGDLSEGRAAELARVLRKVADEFIQLAKQLEKRP